MMGRHGGPQGHVRAPSKPGSAVGLFYELFDADPIDGGLAVAIALKKDSLAVGDRKSVV